MRIIAWNCRGAGLDFSPTIPFVSNLASSTGADFVFLSETKCHVSDLEAIFSNKGYMGFAGVNGCNGSGGLFLCWNHCMSVSVFISCTNFLGCNVVDELNNSTTIFYVYGSPYSEERNQVWIIFPLC